MFSPWQLVERFTKKGIIKGYILYSFDYSSGGLYTERAKVNCSVNVASSLAAILKGILIEEGQESQARQLGLKKLFDARDKSQQWCFETYKKQFNRKILCTEDPKVPHIRALAIAHKAFVLYGNRSLTSTVMAWLEPLSPILGWNCGDEFQQTVVPSEYAHFQTATNWCMNLPILMAGTETTPVQRVKHLDPKNIDWNDNRDMISFVMSDGDNVQWLMGGFFRHAEKSWWNSPDHGRFPFGWTSCFSQLAQLCPQAVDYASRTQPPETAFAEEGGGYYYPDRFGVRRPEKGLLAKHARQVWANMRRCGTKVLAINCQNIHSEQAFKAYRTYAREMNGLLGILVIQYAPYEAGAGQVFWVKDAKGIEIPVVTARYAIWNNANNHGPRVGTPAKIARVINECANEAEKNGQKSLAWTIVHCWSFFKKSPGPDEDAENMDQTKARENRGVRGVTPVAWCIDRLAPNIKVASPEELLWRIRMRRNPEQTQRILDTSR